MGSLNRSKIAEIYSELDNSCLTSHDFKINKEPDEEDTLLIINSIISEARFEIKTDGSSRVKITMSPGKIQDTESAWGVSFDKCLIYIRDWCDFIRKDIRSSQPIYREFDELKKSLQKQLKTNAFGNDEYFSPFEIEELRIQLTELKNRIEILEKDKVISPTQKENLNKQIDTASEDIEDFPKNVWYRTAGNKMLIVVKSVATSKEGRLIIASSVKKLLGLN